MTQHMYIAYKHSIYASDTRTLFEKNTAQQQAIH